MLAAALLATFLVAYATGPAGKDDRTARRFRLDFPKVWALSNEFGLKVTWADPGPKYLKGVS